MDVVHWHMQENGWPFKDGCKDSLYGSKFIRDIYYKAQPDYSGRFTVPVLWDKKTETIGKKYFVQIGERTPSNATRYLFFPRCTQFHPPSL